MGSLEFIHVNSTNMQSMNEPIFTIMVMILMTISWLDIFHRWIPNVLIATIALLWVPTTFSAQFTSTVGSLLTATTVLGIGMLAWRMRWLGGGDVKLIAALSLWAGPTLTPGLLLAIGVGGGALAAVCLATRHPLVGALLAYLHVGAHRLVPAATWSAIAAAVPCRIPARPSSDTIPYGVAVAAAGGWLAHRLLVA